MNTAPRGAGKGGGGGAPGWAVVQGARGAGQGAAPGGPGNGTGAAPHDGAVGEAQLDASGVVGRAWVQSEVSAVPGSARHPAVRAAHHELARGYEEQIAALEAHGQVPELHLVSAA